MHRHSFRGTKFHRQTDQRQALLRSLADSLILEESIETTLPKAKAVVRYTEKLITKAKTAEKNLGKRRYVIVELANKEAANKLVDEISPKLQSRTSGYFRITRTGLRRGDGAQMAKVSFVDKLKIEKKSQKIVGSTEPSKPQPKAEKSDSQKAAPPSAGFENRAGKQTQPTKTPKRFGIRGNR